MEFSDMLSMFRFIMFNAHARSEHKTTNCQLATMSKIQIHCAIYEATFHIQLQRELPK